MVNNNNNKKEVKQFTLKYLTLEKIVKSNRNKKDMKHKYILCIYIQISIYKQQQNDAIPMISIIITNLNWLNIIIKRQKFSYGIKNKIHLYDTCKICQIQRHKQVENQRTEKYIPYKQKLKV